MDSGLQRTLRRPDFFEGEVAMPGNEENTKGKSKRGFA
jgi:hypothetical protein